MDLSKMRHHRTSSGLDRDTCARPNQVLSEWLDPLNYLCRSTLETGASPLGDVAEKACGHGIGW